MGKAKKNTSQKRKKVKRPLDAAVMGARALAKGNAGVDPAALSEGQMPECIKKLSSEQPEEREAGLQDLTHFVLSPQHCQKLVAHGAPGIAATLLCTDALAPIRSAAAAALRNIILCSDEGDVDSLYPNASFDLVSGIAAALGAVIDEAAQLEASAAAVAAEAAPAPQQEGGEEGGEADEPSSKQQHAGQLTGAYKDVEEFLLLATVLAESNNAAAEAFAAYSHNDFLTRLVSCLQCDGHVEVQYAAAECLKVLSEDSENVAGFINNALAPEAKAFLNTMVSTPPASPSLLRVSVNMCGALLNIGATPTNVQTVMPVLVHALSTSPPHVVQQLVPMLSNDCQLDPTVRQLGVQQQLDRLRALQAALQALTDALAIVCDQQDDDLDDEAAFAANPSAAVFAQSGMLSALVERIAETMIPITDPVLRSVLLEPSESGDIVTLQRVMASVEVGVLSLTSSFMMLLPLQSFGSLQSMWQLIGTAITSRHERLSAAVRFQRQLAGLDELEEGTAEAEAAAVASGTGLLCLPLQLESLCEMAATLQRKDEAGESCPEPAHLDAFTRLVWNPNATPATRSHVLAVVGRIGVRLRQERCTYSCANFINRLLAKSVAPAAQPGSAGMSSEEADTAGEALDALMDLFGDEDFDDNVYVPLGVDATIREALPVLKRHVQALKVTRRGSPAWARKRHLDEVVSNTTRFLQYKRENCRAIAQQAVGKKYRPTS